METKIQKKQQRVKNATDDEVTAARPLQDPSMTDLMEELKIEFRLAQQRNEPNDAVRIQHMMMQMLNDIRNGVTRMRWWKTTTEGLRICSSKCPRQPGTRTDYKAVSTTDADVHTFEEMHERLNGIFVW